MCLFAPFLIEAQEQSQHQLLSSCVAIEKKIFTESNLKKKDSLLFVKATIYKEYEDFENALTTLDRLSNFLESDLAIQVINERIKLNYLLSNHKQVKNLIVETDFMEGYQKTNEIILFESLNNIALREVNLAKRNFESLIDDDNLINEIFKGTKFKNPEKAFILSFIIPGSGQVYAGKVFKGLLSLGVQAPLFYLGINGISRAYVFTESIPAIALFQGFYFGGAEYARELSTAHNQTTIEELSLSMVNAIKKEASFK